MNRRADGPRPQHAATKGRVERSTAPADLRAADAERPRAGSWKAPFRFCACLGTMNRRLLPLLLRNEGGEEAGERRPSLFDFPSPRPSPRSFLAGRGRRPTRSRSTPGSWKAPFRFCACLGTMNRRLLPLLLRNEGGEQAVFVWFPLSPGPSPPPSPRGGGGGRPA